jgi:lipoate-protein ligase A
MRNVKRLFILNTGLHAGQYNMAFDESLADGFSHPDLASLFNAQTDAVLRLYGWSSPTLSIGYTQNLASIDTAACAARGIDVVRRPTGGRAVLHFNELTYSVVMMSPLHAGSEAYREIHVALQAGLRRLGVAATFERSQPDFSKHYKAEQSVACFSAAARHELEVDGKKLVGSAQRRFGDVLLQHGSILLTEDHKAIVDLLATTNGDDHIRKAVRHDLDRKTISVSEVLGHSVSVADAAVAIEQGFRDTVEGDVQRLDATILLEKLQPATHFA